ncbi:MADS-box transcription factor 26-like [Phoenix dactylifera]|uniref:MADS-box transcription factor 26-like n=1 Tax=Phoenix dactylifera TaxID=42345 RepID=A0A8B7BZ63_PHODC|nr:MADS-box transcription factor 26-like [Phoenix dactylifera]
MARGKVQMRRIENSVHRQVTFCKRRAGLLKKAKELSVLTDADIGIIIFSTHGKLYELATRGTMGGLIERYRKASGEAQTEGGEVNQEQESKQEISMLKQEINILQKCLRCMYGDGASENMTLEELHALERHLEIWTYHIRATKMQIMFQEIQSLKNKEGIPTAAKEFFQEKIVEQNGHFDVAPMLVQQNGHFDASPMVVHQNGYFNVATAMDDIPYPLTIQNDYSRFTSSAWASPTEDNMVGRTL